MHYDYYLNRGRECACEICGKEFWVASPTEWVYKRLIVNRDGTSRTVYFHTWSCLKKYDKKHEEEVKQHRKAAAEKQKAKNIERRKQKEKESQHE